MVWFFSILVSGSLIVMLGMILIVSMFRKPELATTEEASGEWKELFWLPVDYFSYHLPLWIKTAGRYFSLYVLVYLRHGFRFLRGTLLWLEHYFADLIDILHGRGGRGKRGSASFFLEKIKEHQDEVRRGVSTEIIK